MTLGLAKKGNGLSLFKNRWDHLFEDFFTDYITDLPSISEGFVPALDVSETKNTILVQAEIPGMNQKDIQVNVQEGVLTIKGEKRQESEEKDKDFHRVERRYGTFTRSIALPGTIDVEKVKATYKDGVLKIELAKIAEACPRTVQVKVE